MRSRLTRWLIRWRIACLRASGVEVGSGVILESAIRVRHILSRGQRGSIRLGDGVQVCHGAVIESWGGAVALGPRVFVGPHAVIYGHGGVEIGPQTLIAMHCCVVSSNHTVPPRGVNIRSAPDILLPVKIGSDVWLGASVSVLGGVTIGDGCVVGAGAVVNSNLPAGSIAVGVPARVIGSRP